MRLFPRVSPLFESIAQVRHGFFTRQGGVSQGLQRGLNTSLLTAENPGHSQENIRRIEAHVGAPLVLCKQVHGRAVLTVDQGFLNTLDPWHPPEADAMVTSMSGVALGVRTADCVPVIWVDPQSQTVGVTHAGWRGALAGILEATRQHFVHPPLVAIGPSIQQNAYEVGPEIFHDFCDQTPGNQVFFQKKKHLYLFDLPGYVYTQLKTLNVQKVDWIQEDTYHNPHLYFSCRRAAHRQEPIFGNMASVVCWNKRASIQ